jgi:centromeric protein E
MTSDGEKIIVAVRLRPMIEPELEARYWPRWEVTESTVAEINGKRQFRFDKTYAPEHSTEELYEELGEQLVVSCMEGFNGCIFCYGQTGSGKTYTMYGTRSSPGIVPLSAESVFAYIQETPDHGFLVRCSYLEVYNESVNDLLNPEFQNLVIQEDKKNGMVITGLTEEVCTSLNQVNSLLYIGETNKQIAATALNMKSSRSHCV